MKELGATVGNHHSSSYLDHLLQKLAGLQGGLVRHLKKHRYSYPILVILLLLLAFRHQPAKFKELLQKVYRLL